ncbi:MAG: hypothetical protein AB1744_15190, partial [Candidatus Zixiibacteriota bacterium]
MMVEKRKRPRWRTSFYFKADNEYNRKYFDVIDQKTKKSIGHLVDLTPEGLRILSLTPIEKEEQY